MMEPIVRVSPEWGRMGMLCVVCLLFGFSMQGQPPVAGAVPGHEPKTAKSLNPVVPLSTQSAEARETLQRGVVKWENHRMAEAVADFRKAPQAAPNFPAAHLFLPTPTPHPPAQTPPLTQ